MRRRSRIIYVNQTGQRHRRKLFANYLRFHKPKRERRCERLKQSRDFILVSTVRQVSLVMGLRFWMISIFIITTLIAISHEKVTVQRLLDR